jgi:carboxypeptidase C (cathepsin A)
LLTENAETDPSFTGVHGAFTAAFNSYVREELKFSSDEPYKPLNGDVGGGWDWKHNAGRGFFPGAPNVEEDLIEALIDNSHLRVQIENGYFDMATPFFATEHTADHLGLSAALRDHISLQYYHAGHMMYLHEEDLDKLKANVGAFIDSSLKP